MTQKVSQLNVRVPEEIAAALTTMAASYEGGKNALVLHALKSLVEGTFLTSTMDGLHQQVASGFTAMLTALDTVSQRLARVEQQQSHLDQRMRALEDKDNQRYASLLQAFDRLKALPSEKSGFLQRLQRTS